MAQVTGRDRFAKLGRAEAESALGEALLRAWNLRADAPPTSGRTVEEFRENLRRVREQAMTPPRQIAARSESPPSPRTLTRRAEDIQFLVGSGRRRALASCNSMVSAIPVMNTGVTGGFGVRFLPRARLGRGQ
jgi:hypothetical protein